MKLSTIGVYLRKPKLFLQLPFQKGLFNWMDDETYLKWLWKATMNYPLNLDNPKTFNEKLQWLKLHDRRDIYTTLVDKVDVKDYVAQRIGAEYVIPTLGVWDRFEDIDFDALPEQFVLKCSHDSGGLVICRDKSKLDKAKAEKRIRRAMKRNYFYAHREWPYKTVKPRILAEPYLEDANDKELRDYKFFTFQGEVRALFIATERASATEETKFDFFDADFNHLPFTNGHPNAAVPPHKPECFAEMKRLAGILGEGIPQVRVDFYEVNGKVYFGEMTLFHWSGMTPFEPYEWDETFGSWIQLPKK